MRIILTNDDGIHASGLHLAEHLSKAGHKIAIVAPDRERSAASHSITLRRDLRVTKLNERIQRGRNPCGQFGYSSAKVISEPVDLVILGINAGQNMGEDVLYSGTVGAAVEACFLGFKAIAVSITSYKEQVFETAAAWMVKMLDLGICDLIPERGILNINIPNIHSDAIKGIRLTSTGHRKYYNFIKVVDELEDGFTYRVGGDAPVWETLKGSFGSCPGTYISSRRWVSIQ